MSVAEDFAELFEGRTDAYGTEEGGCWRAADYQGETSWSSIAAQHLRGDWPCGVYPMVQRDKCDGTDDHMWFVKWGCVDFDVKTKGKPSWDYEDEQTAHVAAVNLQRVLTALGVTSWIERTRSNGRHLWVFTAGWTAASAMRRALLVACGVAGVSSREVNPKQETLADGQLGNYVRLPYPGALVPSNIAERYMISADWHVSYAHQYVPMPVDMFVERALAQRTAPAVLQRIADKYVEPTKPVYTHVAKPYDGNLSAAERLNRAGRAVFLNGDADGDRSRALTYIAYQGRESALTPSEVYSLVDDAARRWGKFEGRPDREKMLMKYVERVFG